MNNHKIIVILGPTASGKTKLAVDLAYKFNGEIVSADSRQVYRRMDIGTGKDFHQFSIKSKGPILHSKIQIPYHLIDVASPNTQFNLAKYQKLAYKALNDILKRGKMPILIGGTGLYLQAVVDCYNLSTIRPNKKLREKLKNKTAEELFIILKKINFKKAENLNNSEKNNKRRLIRYIEIAETENKKETRFIKNYSGFYKDKISFLLIGLTHPKEILHKKIYQRLIDRIEKQGMIEEVKRLHKQQKVSWKRLENFGLEYKYVSLYLQNQLDYNQMIDKINIASRQYAKRQMSWFRRWERQGMKINWIKSNKEAERLVKGF